MVNTYDGIFCRCPVLTASKTNTFPREFLIFWEKNAFINYGILYIIFIFSNNVFLNYIFYFPLFLFAQFSYFTKCEEKNVLKHLLLAYFCINILMQQSRPCNLSRPCAPYVFPSAATLWKLSLNTIFQ